MITLSMDDVDGVILAADAALADIDPDASRLTLAVAATHAVIPKLLEMLEPVLAATRAELAGARAANAHVRDEIREVSESARAQTKRLQRVFEEIDPDAVAAQIIAAYERGGHQVDGRDRAFAKMTVRHTITVMGRTISLSLSVDESFNDL